MKLKSNRSLNKAQMKRANKLKRSRGQFRKRIAGQPCLKEQTKDLKMKMKKNIVRKANQVNPVMMISNRKSRPDHRKKEK